MKTYLKNHAMQLAVVVALGLMAALGIWTPPAESLALAPMVMLQFAPFPVTPELTSVAVAYTNGRMIADEVLPRVPVSLQAFKYQKYPIGEFFTLPETKVGRKGAPNTVEFTSEETTDSTVDHALDDEVPHADIENAKAAGTPDPMARATLGLTKLIVLAREVRTAGVVFDANNYGTNNKVTLSSTGQWSHVDSDPIKAMLQKFDTMMMRPNIGVLGRAVATALMVHPKVVKAFNKNDGDAGVVPMSFVAQLLELEAIHVGEGWVNLAKKGQAANIVRVWGKHAAFLHRNRDADTQSDVTFGFTAQWGARVAGNEYDGKIGMRGGQRVRVGESVKELVTANDLGYLFVDAAA